jgi:hypothetical protein
MKNNCFLYTYYSCESEQHQLEFLQRLVQIVQKQQIRDIVKLFITIERKFDIADSVGNTLLHKAVLFRDIDEVSNIIRHDPQSVFYKNNSSITPLHTLIATSTPKSYDVDTDSIVTSLICAKPDVNAKTIDGNTPLHLAVAKRNHSLASMLLISGSKIDEQNKLGNTALHLALIKGDLQIIKTLLSNDTNITIHNHAGKGVLGLLANDSAGDLIRGAMVSDNIYYNRDLSNLTGYINIDNIGTICHRLNFKINKDSITEEKSRDLITTLGSLLPPEFFITKEKIFKFFDLAPPEPNSLSSSAEGESAVLLPQSPEPQNDFDF